MQAEITGVAYRKQASMPKRLLDHVHGDVLDQAARWRELLSLYPDSPIAAFSVPRGLIDTIHEEGQVETLAPWDCAKPGRLAQAPFRWRPAAAPVQPLGAFLMPRQAVMGHLGAQRRHLEPNALVLLKHEYGVTFRSRLHQISEDPCTTYEETGKTGAGSWRVVQ